MNNNKNKEPLWTNALADKATDGTSSTEWNATGIAIDNRHVEKGDLFIALKGPSNDGHNFVSQAISAGAVAAVVSNDFEPDSDLPLLRVEDTLTALEKLGQASRAQCQGKIIGITGSVGKTGTKELLSIALSALGQTHASIKSFNNHWGVPLTLARMPQNSQFGIFEMGMNNAGELTNLSAQVKPDIAIITNVEPAHIGHFKSVNEIADAKAEIFNSMSEGSIVILNIDNPYFEKLNKAALAKNLKVLSFGEDEDADAQLVDCKLHSDHSRATAKIFGKRIRFKLGIPGKHIVLNTLSALAVIAVLKGDMDKAVEALRNSEPIEGRGQRTEIIIEEGEDPIVLIDESYNASPASMQAAFKILDMTEPTGEGRRIAVLGDMLELGSEGPVRHMNLANPLLKAKADLLFACGPLMEALYQSLPPVWQGGYEATSRDLAKAVTDAIQPGDVILVKGSLGSQMAYVIQALQNLNIKKDMKHAV